MQSNSKGRLSGDIVAVVPFKVARKTPERYQNENPVVKGLQRGESNDVQSMGSGVGGNSEFINYTKELERHIHSKMRLLAKGNRLVGTLEVEFKLDSSGAFYDVQIRKTSRHREVDRKAKELLYLISSFKPWPEGLYLEENSFVIPIRFEEIF